LLPIIPLDAMNYDGKTGHL